MKKLCLLQLFGAIKKCVIELEGVITITHTITSVMFAWFFHILKS
jgi:hypothetical protein